MTLAMISCYQPSAHGHITCGSGCLHKCEICEKEKELLVQTDPLFRFAVGLEEHIERTFGIPPYRSKNVSFTNEWAKKK